MLEAESIWFRQKMEKYTRRGDTILNLGSSTQEFREKIQPHIFRNVLLPLDEKNVQIYHVDMKQEDGIDLVGDVTDNEFIDKLASLLPSGIICSNMLEHIEERTDFGKAVVDVLPNGSYIFASCPKKYPYHPDPIDTMFRPTVEELAGVFPKTYLIEGEVVACGTWEEKIRYECRVNYVRCFYIRIRQIIRLLLSFFKPHEGIKLFFDKKKSPSPSQKLSATCVVLQKVVS